MKVLIFSDIHSNLDSLDELINKHKPDLIYGLGDFEVEKVLLDNRNIVGVKGNSLFDPDYTNDLYIELMGFNLHLTHGHLYNVRGGFYSLEKDSIDKNIDITFFGHTHSFIIKEINNRYFINPGSITLPHNSDEGTYIIAIFDNNKVNIKVIGIYTNFIYDETEIYK